MTRTLGLSISIAVNILDSPPMDATPMDMTEGAGPNEVVDLFRSWAANTAALGSKRDATEGGRNAKGFSSPRKTVPIVAFESARERRDEGSSRTIPEPMLRLDCVRAWCRSARTGEGDRSDGADVGNGMTTGSTCGL